MWEAYFDDGHSHDNASAVVLAGYVGTTAEWGLLADEWNDFLERAGIPYYHSVESAHARRHLEGRSTQACNALHREAVEIITRRELFLIGTGVEIAKYRRIESRLWPTHTKSVPHPEYHHCFHQALGYLSRFMRARAPAEKVSLTIEETPTGQRIALDSYDILATGVDPDLDMACFACPPGFRPKLACPQLQVADVIAYEMGLSLRRYFEPDGRPPRGSWSALWKHAERLTGEPMLWCSTPDYQPGVNVEHPALEPHPSDRRFAVNDPTALCSRCGGEIPHGRAIRLLLRPGNHLYRYHAQCIGLRTAVRA